MAKSYSPSFAKIGFVVFVGVLAIFGALVYLGGQRDQKDVMYAETYFVKSVSGLSVGSPVNFRGVKVGEVAEIGFVGAHYDVRGSTNQLIYVKMSIPRKEIEGYTEDAYFRGLNAERVLDRLIKELSMRAMVTASGITGLSHIEIDNMPDVKPMEVTWIPKHAYIPPAPSLMDNFSDAATKVMNQINQMDFTSTWSNVAASVQSAALMLESAQTMMETRQVEVDSILSDVSDTTASLKRLVEELKENPSLLIRERIAEPLPETRR